jgi:hypothetical protein
MRMMILISGFNFIGLKVVAEKSVEIGFKSCKDSGDKG